MNAQAISTGSVRDAVRESEWQTRRELAASHRLLAHFGFVDLTYNHVSVRVPGEESVSRPIDRGDLLAAVPGLVHHSGDRDASSDEEAVVVRRASLGPQLLLVLALPMLGEGLLGGRRA